MTKITLSDVISKRGQAVRAGGVDVRRAVDRPLTANSAPGTRPSRKAGTKPGPRPRT